MAERVGCGTPCLLGSLGVREVVGSRPGRGNSKESFSSYQDDATFALQFLSHLEGDALNVALLVAEVNRATRARLVGAWTEHYGSPGRLADYRRQFERTTRHEGDDPATFANALETLAIKAFVDMGANARLRLLRDRFVAGTTRTAHCVDTLTAFPRRLPFGTLWTDAGCGRDTHTSASGGLSNRRRRGLYRYTPWTNRLMRRSTEW